MYRGAARFYHRQSRKQRVSIWAFFRSYQLQRIDHLMSLLQNYPFFRKSQHFLVRRRKKRGRK